MDSVASDWFWFWLPLLVVVVVVRALAVPSSLLVSWSWLTSLSHHNSGLIGGSKGDKELGFNNIININLNKNFKLFII